MGRDHTPRGSSTATAPTPTPAPAPAPAVGGPNSDALAASGLQSGGPGPTSGPPASASAAGGPPNPADMAANASRLQGRIAAAITGDPPNPGAIQAILDGLQHVTNEPGGVRVTVGREQIWLNEGDAAVLLDEAQAGLRQAQAASTPEARAAHERHQRQAGAAHDLGAQRSMPGFCTGAGHLVDAVVPDNDSSAELTIAANFPINPSVSVGLNFQMSAEREENRTKLRVQLGAALTGRVDAWIVEAWARAEVHGYIESNGNDGAEAVRMMMYAIRERIAGASTRLADAMFDHRFIEETREGMGEDDYVESGLGASVSGGVGAGTGHSAVGASARAGVDVGTRIEGNDRHEAERHDARTVTLAASAEGHPFGFGGEVELKWLDGHLHETKLEVEGEAQLDLHELEHVVAPAFIGEQISVVQGLIQRYDGVVRGNGDECGMRWGGMASFLGRSTGASFGGAAGLAHVLESHESPVEMEVGYKLKIGVSWEQGKGFKFDCVLSRTTGFEFAVGTPSGREASDRDPFFMQLETSQRVLAIHLGG